MITFRTKYEKYQIVFVLKVSIFNIIKNTSENVYNYIWVGRFSITSGDLLRHYYWDRHRPLPIWIGQTLLIGVVSSESN